MRVLIDVWRVHRFVSRRLLLWTVTVVATLDVGYIIHRSAAFDRTVIQRAVFSHEYFFGFKNDVSARQVALSYELGTWITEEGEVVHDLTGYYNRRSRQIRQSSIGSYPPVGGIPAFVKLGQYSPFTKFIEVLRLLRASNVCFVAFEEWGRTDQSLVQRGIVGPEVRLVTSLSICDP